jgi:hypothetical protein
MGKFFHALWEATLTASITTQMLATMLKAIDDNNIYLIQELESNHSFYWTETIATWDYPF